MLSRPVVLPSSHGQFQIDLITNDDNPSNPHLVAFRTQNEDFVPLIRIHSECLTGDVFGSKRCECGPQLHAALNQMSESDHSYLFYLRQEGRGIGLIAKMQTYLLQEDGMDTVQANLHLGLPADGRSYGMVAQYLLNKGIKRIRLLTNNPEKASSLELAGIEVLREPLQVGFSEENKRYRQTKREYFKHDIE